jgi:multidrug efflux pump subunit AcrB
MGRFMWMLPAVVIVSLIASWIECMFILPSHIYELEKNNKFHTSSVKDKEGKFFRMFKAKYAATLAYVLGHRYKAVFFITIFFFASLFFAANNMKLILFPPGGG